MEFRTFSYDTQDPVFDIAIYVGKARNNGDGVRYIFETLKNETVNIYDTNTTRYVAEKCVQNAVLGELSFVLVKIDTDTNLLCSVHSESEVTDMIGHIQLAKLVMAYIDSLKWNRHIVV
jgi:hypothetical protein